MKQIILLIVVPFLIGFARGTNIVDDDTISEQILTKVRSDFCEDQESYRFEVVSIDRVYQWYSPSEQPAFQVCVVQKFVSKVISGETTTTYIVPSYYMDSKSSQLRKGQLYSHGALDDKTAYWKGIEEKDRDRSGFRILYPKDIRQARPQISEVHSPKLVEKPASGKFDSESPSLALHFFASDPSPVVVGKDFRLLFTWSAKPDSVDIDIYNPSGEHVMSKTIKGEDEMLFPSQVYTKFLKERGKYKIVVLARKTGSNDYETSLFFNLVEPNGNRGWFTLGKPDKEVIYFGEKIRVPVLDLSETAMPMNVYLIGPKGTIYDINPGKETRDGGISCGFDSRVYQKFITEHGNYRFKVETILNGQHFITCYSETFIYSVANELKKQILLDGKTYVLRVDPKASEPLWYYEKTAHDQQCCGQTMNKQLQKLAEFKDSEDEEIWTATPWLKHGGHSYAVFAFSAGGNSLENYKPGQVFWSNKQGLRQTGIKRLVILDEISQVVTDTEFAKKLFRAGFVYYQALTVSNSQLIINPEDINYVRSMTDNPAFAATFLAQAGKSLLTLPEERYKALFLDAMLTETDDVYLTREQRKTIAQSLESAESINNAFSTYAKIARRLPSSYVMKLDENWVMARRGEQWHFLRQNNMPNVGLGIQMLEVAVELTHNQVVLQYRAEKLSLINSEIIKYTPSGNSGTIKRGLDGALLWSDKAYKSGASNAWDKFVEIAKKEGIDAALNLLGKMSSKANSVLLAFEIPNVIFNMDSMYDSDIKAQCAVDISEAINEALIAAIKKAKTSEEIKEWKCVDALYLFGYLVKERFHYHAANMLESAGIGKDAGDFLTQGKTSQWIESQKNMCKGISSMIGFWENREGINDCLELMVTEIGGSSKNNKK